MALQEDGRTLALSLRTGDTVVTKSVRFAVPIYGGVYKAGHYSQGDSVTYGGSMWIAKCDTDLAPGGGNDDWRLAVKRGRDGKDIT